MIDPKPLKLGWAEIDITPSESPVFISGQFHARLSEGSADPLIATALVLESGAEQVIFVTCDLVSFPERLRDDLRARIKAEVHDLGIDPMKVIFNVTHTHTGPELTPICPGASNVFSSPGFALDAISPEIYLRFLCDRLFDLIVEAWSNRSPGGIAFGMDYAVVGRNRRWVDSAGRSKIYLYSPEEAERFRHVEGYEDHSMNLLATYDESGSLSGLVVNVPCPAQENEWGFLLSADFWHETRQELRRIYGKALFILPQVSAAGDQTSHLIMERAANERMRKLRTETARQEIAGRIVDAVGRVLPCLSPTLDRTPVLRHQVETLQLPVNPLTEADVTEARKQAKLVRTEYECEKAKLAEHPELHGEPRWYLPVSDAFRRMNWHLGVVCRYEEQKNTPTLPAEIHVVRLGEIAFASNPFECYLDFGIQIKVRSPAIQTFLVQLAGRGTYVPSFRSVAGGGYGSVAQSNPVGPEGGQVLVESTLSILNRLFEQNTIAVSKEEKRLQ